MGSWVSTAYSFDNKKSGFLLISLKFAMGRAGCFPSYFIIFKFMPETRISVQIAMQF